MSDQGKIKEAMKFRHAVRQYSDAPIDKEKVATLNSLIAECNREGDLNIQLIIDEPEAFNCMRSRYGKFENVKNYIAMVGKDSQDLEKKIGYYGELVVLKAAEMGLGTCWVGMSFSKRKSTIKVNSGEKLVCTVSVGHYANAGHPHNSKPMSKLCTVKGDTPEWFKSGMEAAMLAPTAMNQQKFHIYLDGNTVTAKAERAFFSKLDLGIVKRHFEIGAGEGVWEWND